MPASTAKRQSKVTLQIAQPLSSLRLSPRRAGERFSEGLPHASRIKAAEAAHRHAKHHRPTLRG
jgi:hypothetical protein